MQKYIVLFFLMPLFLFSCKGDRAPKGIISHDRMVSLLIEVHLIDGRMYGVYQSQDSINKYSTSRYDALFKRYGTDSVTFKKSLKYYTFHPTELAKMYDVITTTLKQKTDSLNTVQRKDDSLKRLQIKKVNNALPE